MKPVEFLKLGGIIAATAIALGVIVYAARDRGDDTSFDSPLEELLRNPDFDDPRFDFDSIREMEEERARDEHRRRIQALDLVAWAASDAPIDELSGICEARIEIRSAGFDEPDDTEVICADMREDPELHDVAGWRRRISRDIDPPAPATTIEAPSVVLAEATRMGEWSGRVLGGREQTLGYLERQCERIAEYRFDFAASPPDRETQATFDELRAICAELAAAPGAGDSAPWAQRIDDARLPSAE
jgi:hypothetical protein